MLVAALAAIGIVGGGIVIGRNISAEPESTQSSSAPPPLTQAPSSPATPGVPTPVDGGPFATEFAYAQKRAVLAQAMADGSAVAIDA